MRKTITVVTHSDLAGLRGLIDAGKRVLTRDRAHVESLEEKLTRSEIVPDHQMPPNVVRMNSQVRIQDLDASSRLDYTLVFPQDADIAEHRISVLAPLGTAMLGQSSGDEIEWNVPGGVRRIKVEDVRPKPQGIRTAAGHA
jgi:regulator of nucleoside diphosphate kinase